MDLITKQDLQLAFEKSCAWANGARDIDACVSKGVNLEFNSYNDTAYSVIYDVILNLKTDKNIRVLNTIADGGVQNFQMAFLVKNYYIFVGNYNWIDNFNFKHSIDMRDFINNKIEQLNTDFKL